MGGNDTFMTIVIDIDGVIAVPRKDNLHWNCSEVVEAASSTRSLREKGNKLIFWTSRPEEDRQITVDCTWINQKEIFILMTKLLDLNHGIN
jgi:hypothetical protein